MLYMQEKDADGRAAAKVFSDKDNERELNNFRCTVRAPHQAFRQKRDTHEARPHLELYGDPRLRAIAMLERHLVFPTSVERKAWEALDPNR